MKKLIELNKIKCDKSTQIRNGVKSDAVSEYRDALIEGAEFPPIIVFQNGNSEYILADGWHRLEAFKLAGKKKIQADIRKGDLRKAILFAVGSNAEHGIRRGPGDALRAVEKLLKDKEWVLWSDNAIAGACHCTSQYVSVIRRRMEHAQKKTGKGNPALAQATKERKTVDAKGKVVTVHVRKSTISPVQRVRQHMRGIENLLVGQDEKIISQGIGIVNNGLKRLEKLVK